MSETGESVLLAVATDVRQRVELILSLTPSPPAAQVCTAQDHALASGCTVRTETTPQEAIGPQVEGHQAMREGNKEGRP